MTKLVHHLQWEGEAIAALKARHPDVEFVGAATPEEAAAELADADIFVVAGPYYPGKVAEAVNKAAPRLRWMHSSSIGIDKFQEGGLPKGLTFTSSAGLKGKTVAEHAMTLLLAQVHALPQMERYRAQGHWGRQELRSQVSSVEGKTLLLLGYGSIGQEIAKRAAAFEMKIVALNRSGEGPPPAERVASISALEEWLPRADFIACSLPKAPETTGVIGARALSLMKPSAVIVNVGRGPSLDHEALKQALRSGAIAGACLDVYEAEPLPEDDELWRLQNVILSPHVAGTGGPLVERFAELVCENITRFKEGRALLNEVPGF